MKRKLINVAVVTVLVIAFGLGTTIMTGCKKKEEVVEEVLKDVNPLTGIELVEGEELPLRPVAVSTDNDSYLSRPQSGISLADILYEVPIEGGGSRYIPIYYSNLDELESVGAIRSVRPYMLDIAKEYNAVLVHNGKSPQAQEYFSKIGVDRIAAAEYYTAFYNNVNNNKRLPGNLYSTGESIITAMESLGYDKEVEIRTFSWLSDEDAVSGDDASEIIVNYADGAYNTFIYDEETKLYTKYVKNSPLVDENNDEVFTCANILVQKVPFKLYSGETERLKIDMYKGGDAVMFTQGKVVEGTWERDDEDSATIFRDRDGNEFKMTPGVTAIQVIDTTVKFSY